MAGNMMWKDTVKPNCIRANCSAVRWNTARSPHVYFPTDHLDRPRRRIVLRSDTESIADARYVRARLDHEANIPFWIPAERWRFAAALGHLGDVLKFARI